jgi:hypothetical protein
MGIQDLRTIGQQDYRFIGLWDNVTIGAVMDKSD